MSNVKSYPKMLIWTILAMVLLGLLAALVVSQAEKSQSQITVWGSLPEFSFTAAHNGEPFGLEQMKGKITVVNFIFTRCRSVCPILMPNFAELYKLYENSDKIQLVSITVDPEFDSLAVLNEYARLYGVDDDRWVFLWAPLDDIRELCEQGFMLPADDLPGGHSSKFTLVDANGDIRSYHEGLDQDGMILLKQNIRQLARDME
ncbi:MAG: SCO family protein [Candidatus Zixiibacteriota bacterium]